MQLLSGPLALGAPEVAASRQRHPPGRWGGGDPAGSHGGSRPGAVETPQGKDEGGGGGVLMGE